VVDLKKEIKDIVEIVTLVPESLKTLCFEMLLKDALAIRHESHKSPSHALADAAQEPKTQRSASSPHHGDDSTELAATTALGVQPKVNGGSDITMSDLHMKTKKFMDKFNLTLEDINNVFYKESDKFELLVTDFGATTMAGGQIRIATIQALQRALTDGEFTTTVEMVRVECKMRKCYDGPNFTTNFKKSATFFDFGEWTKDVTELRLSEEGKRALVEVIKNLS
jgi:hypothetical protein